MRSSASSSIRYVTATTNPVRLIATPRCTEELAASRGFTWSDEIHYLSKEAKQKVVADLQQLAMTTEISMEEWRTIQENHRMTHQYFGVYDCGETGLGVISLENLDEGSMIFYSGDWRFAEEEEKPSDDLLFVKKMEKDMEKWMAANIEI